MMTERDRTPNDAASSDRDAIPRSERLRALCAAAEPSASPSEGLRQRVADLAARHAIRPERPHGTWPLPRIGWAAAASAAAVLFCVVLSLAIARGRGERTRVATIVQQGHPMTKDHRRPTTDDRPSAVKRIVRRATGNNAAPRTPDHGARSVRVHEPRGVQHPKADPQPSILHPQPSPGDDLDAINGDPGDAARRAATLPRDEWDRIEQRVRRTIRVRDDFVSLPFPRVAFANPSPRGDGVLAAAVEGYKREAAIVDPRLSREVTLAFKATALSDLCDQLRADTGIRLEAGRGVADEKVTLFCKQMPLREVMRQLARPFGYTWLRSPIDARRSMLDAQGAAPGRSEPSIEHRASSIEYRYELTQDLRSQLLEEELRNRDRNAALLALDGEMQRYRPYLNLSPDEALARAKTAPPEEKKLLERLGTGGWGLAQIYFRLSGNDLAALRAGQKVTFSAELNPQEPGRGTVFSDGRSPQQLPPDLERGILQSQRDRRILLQSGRFILRSFNAPEGLPPAAVPETRAMLELRIVQSELGQFTYLGGPGIFISARSATPGTFQVFGDGGVLAVGTSPAVHNPRNGVFNARWAQDPALRPRVTIRPQASCRWVPEPLDVRLGTPRQPPESAPAPEPRVTTADVLEAVHRATGLPVVSDYYTRLYAPAEVSVSGLSLFEALNRLSDAMRLRWSKDGTWLQFRGAGFFHDRLKEVPNRLLERWTASRQRHGALTLDDLMEIAQLSDAQLDAASMAEGARACFGLAEWDLPRVKHVRAQLRYLTEFTPEQRQQAQTPAGLRFSQMTLAQQQGYLARGLRRGADLRLDELAQATLHVDYTLPGWFRWSPPGQACRPSPVRERTREAALQAALRIDPQAAETGIHATRLDVTFLYTPSPAGLLRLVRTTDDGWVASEFPP